MAKLYENYNYYWNIAIAIAGSRYTKNYKVSGLLLKLILPALCGKNRKKYIHRTNYKIILNQDNKRVVNVYMQDNSPIFALINVDNEDLIYHSYNFIQINNQWYVFY